MATTRKLFEEDWKKTFETFSKRHLHDSENVTIEVLSPEIGDQFEATNAALLGIDYDEKDRVLEVILESIDHLSFKPKSLWVIEEDDGFIDAVQIVRPDGMVEVIQMRRAQPLMQREESALLP